MVFTTMLRVLCCSLLIPSHISALPSSKVATSSRLRSISTAMAKSVSSFDVGPSLLAKAWTPQLIELEEKKSTSNKVRVEKATERTLPLLEDAASVPFVCRYRTDVIDPLTTRQVHFLQSLLSKHASLGSLRSKLLQVISDEAIQERIQTSTSKTELDDLYAPFKPPAKGSILERIRESHPALVEAVDKLWSNDDKGAASPSVKLSKLGPHQELVQLLSTKIASEPKIALVVVEELRKHCRVKTTSADPKYRNYDNFSGHLAYLKDHQVLAIRRGVQQKLIKMSYEIDAGKMEGCILYHLRSQNLAPTELLFKRQDILTESIHDAWTRLLRRRGTSRLWNDKCKDAQERGCQVFEDNLRRALLAPPLIPSSPVLSLDPGFQAGIKCAILDSNGVVVKLDTIKFLGNRRDDAVAALKQLLDQTKKMSDDSSRVLVALGNGHGSQDCRALFLDACKQRDDIDVDIRLVNEAGASVWSVTETAKVEFPDQPPAAIAAISIGRRLQNPLFELVKVPPRSLGLGMYQHDMSEKELDEKLQLTSVDAVATVGVEVNSCSLEILKQVPGLNKLADKVIQARPLKERSDLLKKVPRLGAKTFENCAAFCRVNDGPEPLDTTLVHPESYDLARWLLKAFGWKLDEKPEHLPPTTEWKKKWGKKIDEASKKFGVSGERVMAVLENLVDSMMKVDPRLKEAGDTVKTTVGSVDKCSALSPELADIGKLACAAPVRGVIGTIRNIADFGAFIDFGAENDGLLHTSKLGPLKLSNLLIGQELGVDILSVTDGKVSLGVTGLNQEPSLPSVRAPKPRHRKQDNRSGSKRSMATKGAGEGQKRQKKR
jgi:uncharacterized protein